MEPLDPATPKSNTDGQSLSTVAAPDEPVVSPGATASPEQPSITPISPAQGATPGVDPISPPEETAAPAPPAVAEPETEPSPPPVIGGPDPAGPVIGGPDPADPVAGGPGQIAPAGPAAAAAPGPSKGPLKAILIALIAVLVIGGASAAAYLGFVLPNKPINVLKISLANSLQQTQSSFKGSMEANPSSGGPAYKLDFSGASDTVAKAADVKLNFTVTGISFPVEARLVDKNAYVKVGDLTTIATLIDSFSPDAGNLTKSLSSQLSNKWIVFDSTLLNQSGAGCFLDANWQVSNADIKLLNQDYDKNPFVTIKSTASDSVNGKKAEKFVLSIDDDKLAAYGSDKTLDNLSLAKATQKCDKSATKNVTAAKGDHKQTPVTVWVDKGKKRIVKVAYEDKQGNTSEVTIDYSKVTITAPSNAVPAMQILAQLEQAAASNPSAANLLNTGGGVNIGQ